MAYPFLPGVRYADFLAQLTSMGVQIKDYDRTHVNDEGDEVNLVSLENVVDGEMYYFPLTFASDSEIVQPPVIRSICTALRINPVKLGYALGLPGETKD